ncbi:MAG: sigma-70 family RNA polymerase sigma factor [Bacteroidota bacterium]
MIWAEQQQNFKVISHQYLPMHDVTQLWQQFHHELRQFILNKTQDDSLTDDVLQDVFEKIVAQQHRLERVGYWRGYLYRMVQNTLHDHYRRQKRRTFEHAYPTNGTEAENESLQTTIAEVCVRPLIMSLPEKYREALVLSELEQIPQKELAQRLSLSYSGVKSRVQRGRMMLKELILTYCGVESDRYGNLREVEKPFCYDGK